MRRKGKTEEQREPLRDLPGVNGPELRDGKETRQVSPQTPGTPAYLTVTEDSMKAALLEARGDIFVASQLLGITAVRLDRAIRVSDALQQTILALKELKFSSLDSQQIHEAVNTRLSLYRVVGLDALHDLATMPIDENSAQNQVKLAAAARLAGPTDGLGGSGEMGETFKELRDLYHQHAPRLRVIRERTTVELSPADEHRVIDAEKKE